MKLSTFLFLLTFLLIGLNAFGILALPWLVVFLPAIIAFGLGIFTLLLAGAAVAAAVSSEKTGIRTTTYARPNTKR